ncbi:flavodoxin family protein [Pseudodesulfovibrio cashew]|uniref:Flavodoxin family protein n=1 Tax=Pseudodesulfovibrio cashew TaxID=2678688 RepID=A0A6I6JEQ9_9BACT|nr:NAD(P)H-dependent oxidoreductase [Pseudodesulfovibrio cashew]QGY41336.1 flavodoxin family protein [Pseudodesulfovibrio cashew]
MTILIILAHPNETSFNHAIADRAHKTLSANGHTVIFHDLYKEKFEPALPGEEIQRDVTLPEEIARHCSEAAEADGIIVVHPNWWGMPPALLTGWVDRVMRPGLAYEFVEGDDGEGVPVGLLKAKKAMVFNTSNTYEERENRVFGDPLERIWRDCVFDLCGVKETTRKVFRVIVTSTQEEREAWLHEVEQSITTLFPTEP